MGPDNKQLKRRRAAILVADVAGYSSMMERDEEGTYERIDAFRRDLLQPVIDAHHGRLVKTTGDGFLGEFASAIDAIRCALSLQERIAADSHSEENALRLRIGVNLDEVIVGADGDLYGDGVNVAARLEQLADPGAICISGEVYAEIQGEELRAGFKDKGEQQVKNIVRPVRVFAVRPNPAERSTTFAIDHKTSQVIDYCPQGAAQRYRSRDRRQDDPLSLRLRRQLGPCDQARKMVR